jgi:peptide/nickel transport system substrate-binding protein
MKGTRSGIKKMMIAVVALMAAAGMAGAQGTTASAGGTGGTQWHEAPGLHEKAVASQIPPLAKRLPNPKDVMIEKVVEEIGQYGGDLHLTWGDYSSGKWSLMFTEEPLFRFLPDGTSVIPNVAKSVDINADYTQFTVHLREGMKWSDGVPFTADDVLFYWEHMAVPETFGKKLYDCFFTTVNGEKTRARVEKIDSYTFRITHAASFPLFLERLAIDNKWFFAPAHYYKTILPEFIGQDKALEIAKKRGFGDLKTMGTWTGYYYWVWPDRPTLRPWVAKNDPSSDRFIMERNPYYWKTDSQGNQLPYIDRIVVDKVPPEQEALKRLAGEIDISTVGLPDYATYQSNKDKGGYRIIKWRNVDAGTTFYINQTVEDLGLRALFRNVSFRAGLSHAINREEINDILWNGLLTPRQASLLPGLPNYSADWEKKFVEYNPALAASLFDKVGLKWDAARKYRTRPDGSELAITIHCAKGNAPLVELASSYWEKVGIKTATKVVDDTYYHELKYGNQLQVGVSNFSVFNLAFRPDVLVPFQSTITEWSGAYGLWHSTNGKQGVEPDADVKLIFQYWDNIMASKTKADVTKWADKIVEVHARNVWAIGIAGISPTLVVVKNQLRNVPADLYSCDELRYFGVANPSQWFFRQK